MEKETSSVTRRPNPIISWLVTILLLIILIVVVAIGLFIVLPIYLIIKAIRAILGIGKAEPVDIRAKNGVLQSPVVTFRKDPGCPEVVFVGAVHVGEKEYYQKIQNILDEHFQLGHCILVEGVGKNDTSPEDIDSMENAKLKQMEKMFEIQSKIPAMMNLVFQRDGINYNPQWKNSDVSINNIAKRMVECDAEALSDKDIKSMEELFANPNTQKIIPIALDFAFSRILPYLSNRLTAPSKQKKFMDIITTEREEHLFSQICAELDQKKTVVLFWGSAHLIGITKRLRKIGYYQEQRSWLDVFHSRFSNLASYNQALKEVASAMKEEEKANQK